MRCWAQRIFIFTFLGNERAFTNSHTYNTHIYIYVPIHVNVCIYDFHSRVAQWIDIKIYHTHSSPSPAHQACPQWSASRAHFSRWYRWSSLLYAQSFQYVALLTAVCPFAQASHCPWKACSPGWTCPVQKHLGGMARSRKKILRYERTSESYV